MGAIDEMKLSKMKAAERMAAGHTLPCLPKAIELLSIRESIAKQQDGFNDEVGMEVLEMIDGINRQIKTMLLIID